MIPLRYLSLILFIGLSMGLYFQAIQFGYALDDQIVVSENKFVAKGLGGLREIFTTESFTGYFGTQQNLVAGARYRPLSIATFAIEYELFGFNPRISHAINILLYALCAYFIFLVILKLLKNQYKFEPWKIALLTSLIYLCHPVHTEAVANIKGRDEIMCFIFSLLCLYYFLKYFDLNKRKDLLFSSLFLFLGLLSKENAISFLAIIPLSLFFFRDCSLWKGIKISWPLIAVSLIFIYIRIQAVGFLFNNNMQINDLMNDPFVEMNVVERYSTIALTIVWYIKLLFFPHPLTHDYYPYHVPKMSLGDPATIGSLILILGLLYLAWYYRKKEHVLSFGILFFFITLLLVSNIFFSVGTFMNERFIFIPSLGFCFLLGYYLIKATAVNKILAYSSLGMSIVILSLFSLKTIWRVPDWKDGDHLNFAAISVSRNSARINLFTGVTYFHRHEKETDPEKKKQNLRISEQYIDKAISIYPDYSQANNMKAGVLAEYFKTDKDVLKFLTSLKEVVTRSPELSFVQEYIDYLKKDASNHPVLYDFLKDAGFNILYKKNRNHSISLKYLGSAYQMRTDDGELLFAIATVYKDWSVQRGISYAKSQEYLKQGNSFLQKAIAINPKYAQ
ncbi:MAG: glycosyltransferase family 39 protein [Bacteroidota bacterium]|nr:glycosyltransferase family 39 protein [Bacteroidota bacterium]